MKLFEKILVPVDVNADSKAQLKAAIKIARSYNSEIITMYVAPEEVEQYEIKDIVINAITDSLKTIKKTFIKARITTREPLLKYGKPVDKILEVATRENVNLILVGSGMKGKREKYKLGITTERLINMSDIPVWVVKSKQKTDCKNILCPVDCSAPSERALNNAILLSARFQSDLTILAVYEPIMYISPRIKVDIEEENSKRLELFEDEMKHFISQFHFKGIKYKTVIQTGKAEEKILQTIKENAHDLLIMGTNGRSGLSRLIMGSITEKVTREVPCSFITTKVPDTN
jgi:nucleotide-binding universal stress UspA family protein